MLRVRAAVVLMRALVSVRAIAQYVGAVGSISAVQLDRTADFDLEYPVTCFYVIVVALMMCCCRMC
jgi:hypothetical protein